MNSATAQFYNALYALPGGAQSDRERQWAEKLADALIRAEEAEERAEEAEEQAEERDSAAEVADEERNAAEERAEVAEKALAGLREASEAPTVAADKIANLQCEVDSLKNELEESERLRWDAIERMRHSEEALQVYKDKARQLRKQSEAKVKRSKKAQPCPSCGALIRS
jgi:DNA repair exonuclease SbcCD ATPase subunit